MFQIFSMVSHNEALVGLLWIICTVIVLGANHEATKSVEDTPITHIQDTPSILNLLFLETELNNLLRHCMDRSHPYSITGAAKRLSWSSYSNDHEHYSSRANEQLQDTTTEYTNFRKQHCILKHMSGKYSTGCREIKNDTLFQIMEMIVNKHSDKLNKKLQNIFSLSISFFSNFRIFSFDLGS